jgi:hypothetical protein
MKTAVIVVTISKFDVVSPSPHDPIYASNHSCPVFRYLVVLLMADERKGKGSLFAYVFHLVGWLSTCTT